MYLFYDTETNGLPKDWKAKITDLDNWPRIIQFAFQVYGSDGKLIVESKDLILPDGWEIPKEKFWIENGYSTEQNQKEGVPLPAVLDTFMSYYEQCTWMIAHNQPFDYAVTGAELIRYKKMAGAKRIGRICTMEASTNFCRLTGKNGGYKWPKLEELHRILFKESFAGAHDALADVRACARCFFELKARGIIILPNN